MTYIQESLRMSAYSTRVNFRKNKISNEISIFEKINTESVKKSHKGGEEEENQQHQEQKSLKIKKKSLIT